MTDNIKIRELTIADLDVVSIMSKTLHLAMNPVWSSLHLDPDQLDTRAATITRLESGLSFGAYDGDKLVGLCLGYIRERHGATPHHSASKNQDEHSRMEGDTPNSKDQQIDNKQTYIDPLLDDTKDNEDAQNAKGKQIDSKQHTDITLTPTHTNKTETAFKTETDTQDCPSETKTETNRTLYYMEKFEEMAVLTEKIVDPYVHYGVTKAYHFYGLGVIEEYQHRGLGYRLAQHTIQEAIRQGIRCFFTRSTGVYSASIYQKLKFEKLAEIRYDEFLDENGIQVFYPPEPHYSVILWGKLYT